MIGSLAELILRTNPRLLSALRLSYRYVFLDEFQDTTGNQFQLLNTAFMGASSHITGVGDNKQRIMLWAHAKRDVFAGISFFSPDSLELYRSSAVWEDQRRNFGRKTERFRAAVDSTA